MSLRFAPVLARDASRFVVVYAAATAVFAAVISAVTSLPGLAAASGVAGPSWVLSSLLRSAAPMASGSALLLALVLWAHPLALSVLSAELGRTLKQAFALVLPGYLLAASVALATCLLLAQLRAGHGFGVLRGWLAHVGASDLGAGVKALLLDTALILFLAWRYAPRLQAFRLSLPAKLIVVVTVTVPLRATVALIVSSLLPG